MIDNYLSIPCPKLAVPHAKARLMHVPSCTNVPSSTKVTKVTMVTRVIKTTIIIICQIQVISAQFVSFVNLKRPNT